MLLVGNAGNHAGTSICRRWETQGTCTARSPEDQTYLQVGNNNDNILMAILMMMLVCCRFGGRIDEDQQGCFE